MIAVECVQCDHRFVCDDQDAGRKVACPNCRALVRVQPPAPVVVRWGAGEAVIRGIIFTIAGIGTVALIYALLMIAGAHR